MDETREVAIRALVEPILAERQLELVEWSCRPSGGQLWIRLLVDKSGGVTLQECARANQLISQALEASNAIEGRYTVEVSSPGLDRPLVNRRDFERAIGEYVQLERQGEDGRWRQLQGALLAVQEQAIVVTLPTGNLTVPLAQIRAAKKAVRW